ncbi:MAG: amidophosphoribosyltransferase [Clostridiales bacterium]|nr:amidophosphoribosyltransferase [Clostridiales bacterium]
MFDKLHEECGLFGIYSRERKNLAADCYYALYALQHRGQESCGIAVNDRGVIHCYKDVGLVNEVFTKEKLAGLGEGRIAVGHVRYGTAGVNPQQNAQPMVVHHMKGTTALAHNGVITNAQQLRDEMEAQGAIFHTTSDAEVISQIIAAERLHCNSVEEAAVRAMDRLDGAYSLVIMSPSKLIAVRDPRGFRPLCIGEMENGCVVFASESCALDSVGATLVRDVEPGEVVVMDKNGMRSLRDKCGTCPKSHCIFEYIYFARPDSTIDGSSVHMARQRAGAFLALEHPVQADVVIGVPDSGLDAAMGYARQSGIPYGLGFIKNKYIGRTFIQPTQSDRENLVRIKLNPVSATVKGKRVVLIDDSIVRGTTCARIIKLLRDAGATEVHMRSSAPEFRFPCYFGTDIPSPENLIANKHTTEEIAKIIGVDSLGFLSCENVIKLCENTQGFCTACFDGKYPCQPPKDCGTNKHETLLPEEEE